MLKDLLIESGKWALGGALLAGGGRLAYGLAKGEHTLPSPSSSGELGKLAAEEAAKKVAAEEAARVASVAAMATEKIDAIAAEAAKKAADAAGS